ncbi:PfkB family carbohydrate kinase [Aestuariispira ectoiniformans]|uniref:PfkB family carbohydrate kinase n=1 Tax=Aestuariispira ectoiniformans TaxID=2775080 RepID=UPI00223ADD46|nr:PfkB family carbohydrate kinase [Aestuariispira ectoiniformans]
MGETVSILCFGALHHDRIAKCLVPFRARASNPIVSRKTPGGVAHNIARNLANLGLEIGMSTLVGGDGEGDRLIAGLEDYRIDSKLIQRRSEHPTASYTAVMDVDGELAVGLADMAIYDTYDAAYVNSVLAQARRWQVWLADANLPAETLELLSKQKGERLFCAAPVSPAKAEKLVGNLQNVDVLVGNGYEIAVLAGKTIETSEDAASAARELVSQGVKVVVVTMGPNGAVMATSEECGHWSIPDTALKNVNGAGDSFYAGFLAAYAQGIPATVSVTHGLAMASLTSESDDPVRDGIKPADLQARIATIAAPTYF